MVQRPHPHSFPFLSLSSPSPHLAQLRLHLSPATEAPTPADPLPTEKKPRTEAGKGDGIEGREISEEAEAAGKRKSQETTFYTFILFAGRHQIYVRIGYKSQIERYHINCSII